MGRHRGDPERERRRPAADRAPLGHPAPGRDSQRRRLPHQRRVHQPAGPGRDRTAVGRGGRPAEGSRDGPSSVLTHTPTEGGTHVRIPQGRTAHGATHRTTGRPQAPLTTGRHDRRSRRPAQSRLAGPSPRGWGWAARCTPTNRLGQVAGSRTGPRRCLRLSGQRAIRAAPWDAVSSGAAVVRCRGRSVPRSIGPAVDRCGNGLRTAGQDLDHTEHHQQPRGQHLDRQTGSRTPTPWARLGEAAHLALHHRDSLGVAAVSAVLACVHRIAAKCPHRSRCPDPIDPAPSTMTTGGSCGCRTRIAARADSNAATIGALIGPPSRPFVDTFTSTRCPGIIALPRPRRTPPRAGRGTAQSRHGGRTRRPAPG